MENRETRSANPCPTGGYVSLLDFTPCDLSSLIAKGKHKPLEMLGLPEAMRLARFLVEKTACTISLVSVWDTHGV